MIHFEGPSNSDYLLFGSPSILELTDAVTIMHWLERDVTNNAICFYHGGGWSSGGYGLHINSGQMRMEMQQKDGSPKVSRDFAISGVGVLQHIAGTWDYNGAQTMQGWVDGAKVGGTSTFGALMDGTERPLSMAWSQDDGGRRLDGRMHDNRIYNRQLLDNELLSIATRRGSDGIVYGRVFGAPMNEGYPGQVVSGAGVVKDAAAGNNNTSTNGTPEWRESESLGVRRRRAA